MMDDTSLNIVAQMIAETEGVRTTAPSRNTNPRPAEGE